MLRIIILLFAFLSVCGNSYANQIDSLRTDDDVVNFVNSFSPRRRNITAWDLQPNTETDRAKDWQGRHILDLRRIYDSLKIEDKRWLKTDLNDDGKTDLLVFARDWILAIVSDRDSFRLESNYYTMKYIYILPVIKNLNNQNIILIYYIAPLFDTKALCVNCDTLIFRHGHFFNYLKNPKHFNIERIELHDNGFCEGNCLKIDITIDAKLLVGHYSTEYSLGGGKQHSGSIAPKKITDILKFFDYSNFPDLNEYYASSWSDQTTTIWEVTYNIGKIKTISDYGQCGSATLYTLFDFMTNDLFEESK